MLPWLYSKTFLIFQAASSRRLPAAPIIPPCPGRNLLSTISDLIDLASALDEKPCGCKDLIPTPCACGKTCNCKSKEPCYIDVILPPAAAELPCGLGYLPSAAPLVACSYGITNVCDACIPVTSPYSCTCLATPLCPELRAFAKPVIL